MLFNNNKSSFFIAALLLATVLTASCVVAICTSTSEDFRVRTVTINVQPSQPILVQRYQAPQLRIFCFSTEQVSGAASAACPSTANTNALKVCSRRADQPDATADCEDFASISTETSRGSINGNDMVWDIMWDGSSLSPQCFPRGVRFSYLALVRGKEVASIALFVVLLIIAILAIILGIASLGVFVRQKYYIFDSAGATTLAGPKGDFAGHQMQVKSGAAEETQTSYDSKVPTVYLPVRSNGAGSPMYGADGEELTDQQVAEMQAQNNMHGGGSRAPRAIAMKGASPPRPGDGIDGFEGATREMDFYDEDGNPIDDLQIGGGFVDPRTGKYMKGPLGRASGGSSIRKRRGYKPHRGGKGGEDEWNGPGGRRNKALFPTHYDMEKTDGFSHFDDGSRRPGEKFDRHSSGVYVDEDGNAYSRDGQKLAGGGGGVRYVPQWMHDFHARDDDNTASAADAFDPTGNDDGLNQTPTVGGAPLAGTRDINKPRQIAGELGIYNKPKSSMKKSGVPIADGYESDGQGGRKVSFASGEGAGKNRSGPNSRNPTPTGNKSRGFGPGAAGDEENAGGSSRYGAGGAGRGGPGGDSFNRDRAQVFTKSLNLDKEGSGNWVENSKRGFGGTGPDRTDVVRKFGNENENTISLNPEGPKPVMQCVHCKSLIGAGAPKFCAVTGEAHM